MFTRRRHFSAPWRSCSPPGTAPADSRRWQSRWRPGLSRFAAVAPRSRPRPLDRSVKNSRRRAEHHTDEEDGQEVEPRFTGKKYLCLVEPRCKKKSLLVPHQAEQSPALIKKIRAQQGLLLDEGPQVKVKGKVQLLPNH